MMPGREHATRIHWIARDAADDAELSEHDLVFTTIGSVERTSSLATGGNVTARDSS
jgi:hypothetical protein